MCINLYKNMNQDMFNLDNKIYSNNIDLLVDIYKELEQINNKTNNNLIIKIIGDIIKKMKSFINENKINTELIIK